MNGPRSAGYLTSMNTGAASSTRGPALRHARGVRGSPAAGRAGVSVARLEQGGESWGRGWAGTLTCSPWRPSLCCPCWPPCPRTRGTLRGNYFLVLFSAPSVSQSIFFTIMEKASIRAFSWLNAPTSAFTFKTLLRHYAKRVLTPW